LLGDSGTVMIVKPMSTEYPKWSDGIAAGFVS